MSRQKQDFLTSCATRKHKSLLRINSIAPKTRVSYVVSRQKDEFLCKALSCTYCNAMGFEHLTSSLHSLRGDHSCRWRRVITGSGSGERKLTRKKSAKKIGESNSDSDMRGKTKGEEKRGEERQALFIRNGRDRPEWGRGGLIRGTHRPLTLY